MDIIDKIYDIQVAVGEISKPFSTRDEEEIVVLEKEIIHKVGIDTWEKYIAAKDVYDIEIMKHHYKIGLKDGAKLIMEMIK